ncbi:hypothetical protein [Microcoleus sp. herbarium14]|uniref:hypothetical protein n=1 Tax=Microcoleus sp. herbarium14 TaxID=3055439 RepID=UPI002FD746AF
MTLRDDIEQWRSKVAQLLEAMDEVRACADRLSECPTYELDWQFSTLLEMCEESLSQVERLREELEEIQSRWGFGTIRNQKFLASVISPTTKLANTTVNDASIQDAIAKSEIFLTTAIASGVPTWLALELANIPGDSWMLYENPNATERLTDLTQNPASEYYQKKPSTQLQGDQGELALLKMLLDFDDTENLLSSLQIKPKLNFKNGKDYCKPDFYLTSHRLICDAKAYKRSSINGIKTAAKKYVNYLQENGGGEVKFYVPRDTYAKSQHKLNRLQSQQNGVNVTIHPMTIDYEHILWKKELIYTYLKSLLSGAK